MTVDLKEYNKIHFIAIGGVGMSAIAIYLKENGFDVSGSDISESKYTEKLKKLGVEVEIGHNAELIENNMLIVCSTAISKDNVELKRANELGLTVLHRSDLLAIIANEFSNNNRKFFGFSGSHGKTTTSGMCSYVLKNSGFKPSFIVGGNINNYGYNAEYDSDDYFSAELDESDGTIIKYTPNICVINNLEADHLDFYKNGISDVIDTFKTFLLNLKPNSVVILNNESDACKQLLNYRKDLKFVTFGLNSGDYVAKNIEMSNNGTKFDVMYNGNKLETVEISLLGVHNVYNAFSVFVALKEAGIEMKKAISSFKSFNGMGRRYQFVTEFDGIKVYDDYAHHPSEIKMTLESVKKSTSNRIVLIFQPHRYTRLKALWNDFLTSFDFADKVILTDVYAASEKPIEGIDTKTFVQEMKHKDCVYIAGDLDNVAKKTLEFLKPNDIVITMGAGSITKVGKLLEKYNSERAIQLGN